MNENSIFFYQVDLSAVIRFGRSPGSVEVVTCDVASRITEDDSVGVEHGYYFEYEVSSQSLSLSTITTY